MEKPDFYLTSVGELDVLTMPRACRIIGRARAGYRDDCVLVSIDPPALLDPLSSDRADSRLILCTRLAGQKLDPASPEWPVAVFVHRAVGALHPGDGFVTFDDTPPITWAVVYRDYLAAAEAASHSLR